VVEQTVAHERLPAAVPEAFEGVLADRLEHPEAAAGIQPPAVDQVAFEQLLERCERVGAPGVERFGAFQRPAVGEDGERREPGLRLGGEQLVAPGERRPQRPLALVAFRPAAAECVEAMPEPGDQLLRREQPSRGAASSSASGSASRRMHTSATAGAATASSTNSGSAA
jgi:hypothetical protein